MLKTTAFHKIELTAVIVTGILKFILVDWLMWRVFYIAGICILWLVYILFSFSNDKNILKYWGFKKEYLKSTLVWLMPLVILCMIFSILYGHLKGYIYNTWHILPFLLLYPIWGIFQQYMMLGIISNNLMRFLETKVNRFLIVVIVSVLFSLIHYPSFLLMVIVFFIARLPQLSPGGL